MTDLALAYTPATELARRIRAREISPVEVIDNALARIDEVEPTINAFCLTCPDEAREKAVAAEQAVTAGDDIGPLHGVPTGFSAGNLPTGMQIVGRRFDDVGVLRVGAALESARPWAGRHPAI